MSIRFPMGESLSHDLISTLELFPLDGQGLLHQPGWAGCRESPAGSAHSVPSVSARGLSEKGGCVLTGKNTRDERELYAAPPQPKGRKRGGDGIG